MIYNSMNGDSTSAGREEGATATVGVHVDTGTVATAESDALDHGTGSSWSYRPVP